MPPDLSASPYEDCPCGSGHLVKVARKPDQDCQKCLKKCAGRKFVVPKSKILGQIISGAWLCPACISGVKLAWEAQHGDKPIQPRKKREPVPVPITTKPNLKNPWANGRYGERTF